MTIEESLLETVMSLIMHGGDAKSSAMEAIHAAKRGQFDEADNKLDKTNEALNKAHKAQSSLLSKEARGDTIQYSLLLTHGQDHLMNAVTTKYLAIEIIDLYRKLADQDISQDS
jgi:PTS system cellobiose-specific IIA component